MIKEKLTIKKKGNVSVIGCCGLFLTASWRALAFVLGSPAGVVYCHTQYFWMITDQNPNIYISHRPPRVL